MTDPRSSHPPDRRGGKSELDHHQARAEVEARARSAEESARAEAINALDQLRAIARAALDSEGSEG